MSLHELQENLTGDDAAEILQDVAELEAMREQRMGMALRAARYIVDECRGITTNRDLYYLAMFGRSLKEGISERDQNLSVPTGIAAQLGSSAVGDPFALHAPNYPEYNVTVGRLASFSDTEFQPTQYKVDIEKDTNGFTQWRGRLAVAMHEVVPVRIGDSSNFTYRLADEVSEVETCETATWTGFGGLEIVPRGSGGLEIGDEMRINSQFGHDQRRKWLYDQQVPTGRRELTPELERLQLNERQRQQAQAAERGVSEGLVVAESLSPTKTTFLQNVRKHASADEPPVIDETGLFKSWGDAYDAQEHLTGLEIKGLVDPDDAGRTVLSALGRNALEHLENLE